MASLSLPLQLRCSAFTPLPACQPPDSSAHSAFLPCLHARECMQAYVHVRACVCARGAAANKLPEATWRLAGARGTSTYGCLRQRRRQPTDAPVTSSSSSSSFSVFCFSVCGANVHAGSQPCPAGAFLSTARPIPGRRLSCRCRCRSSVSLLASSPSILTVPVACQKKIIPVCRAHMMAPRCPCIVINGHNSG